MPDQIALLAQQLNEATRRGDLAGAYATLKGLRINDAARVASMGGVCGSDRAVNRFAVSIDKY
ncbi:hypothetical protein [Xanthomonas hortorum]|uniref:hypothetical protein n=1 Tax=Xanthomonas hortorum TaxID=56454 RepID=UPI0015D57674|nr:hypothetical protein [Xanthomonas hortorum]MCE4343639.1 hypothetical protein [Xanthomonas hortorum pv. vitians]NMI19985.1 hypothetical protein [Xanthomonas hortorum pv. vitians]